MSGSTRARPRVRPRSPARYTLAVAAVGAVVSSLCSACGSSSSPGSSSSSGAHAPFTVVYDGAVTGPFGPTEKVDFEGLMAAANYLNARGGILGHKVQVTLLNDNSDPATGVSVLQSYLSTHPKPDFVEPGTESNESAAILPVCARDHILAFSQTDGGLTAQFTSKASTEFPEQYIPQSQAGVFGSALAQYVLAHGYKKVGVLEDQLAFTEGESSTLIPTLHAHGVTTAVVPFQPTALDLTAEVSTVQSKHVDLVLLEAGGPPVGYALQALAKLGWHGPILGDLPVGQTDITTLVSAADYKNMSSLGYAAQDYVAPSERPSGLTAMVTELNAEHATYPVPITGAGVLWDQMILLNHAANQAHSIDGNALVAALDHLKVKTDPLYVLNLGGLAFTSSNHEDIVGSIKVSKVASVGPVIEGFNHPGAP
jgi:branched-chain amino acid transport system substrate-binding protein